MGHSVLAELIQLTFSGVYSVVVWNADRIWGFDWAFLRVRRETAPPVIQLNSSGYGRSLGIVMVFHTTAVRPAISTVAARRR